MGTESITAAEVRNTYLHEWLECGHSVKVTTDLPPVPIVRYLNRY